MTDVSPVTFDRIIDLLVAGKFKPMTEADLQGFAGVEGAGYIGEYGDFVIVLDVFPAGAQINIIEAESGDIWAMLWSGDAHRIC